MALRRDEPFPTEAVRDLLGVVRALYGAAKDAGKGRAELDRIQRVGADLHAALELAESVLVGSVAHRTAVFRAEDATRRVGDLIDVMTPAAPVVASARGRVMGRQTRPKRCREER